MDLPVTSRRNRGLVIVPQIAVEVGDGQIETDASLREAGLCRTMGTAPEEKRMKNEEMQISPRPQKPKGPAD